MKKLIAVLLTCAAAVWAQTCPASRADLSAAARLSPYFASRLLRSLPEPRRGVSDRTRVLGGGVLLGASLLLAVADWPHWLSATAILLAPLAALAMLAPGRIAAGVAAVFVVLLREDDGRPPRLLD